MLARPFRHLAFSSVSALTSRLHLPTSGSIISRQFTMGAGSQTVHTSQRLTKLREFLAQEKVHAFVVPSEDQHSSEYLADCDERRAFISGFNGSAGCAIITPKEAFLFTDGRYFLQAEQQLDENWTLMKQGLPDVPTWQEFLSKKIEPSSRIGIDSTLISAVDAESLTKELKPRGSELVSLSQNPVDSVWAQERPPRPKSQVFSLDVFFAYAVITLDKATLFINPDQLDDASRRALGDEVAVRDYSKFFDDLKGLAKELDLKGSPKVLLGDKSSLAVAEAVGQGNYALIPSPVAELKAIKNETELEGFRQSHIRDGAALARYFSWLEEQLEAGVELNESQAADKLEQFRTELDLFRGLSFPTISCTGPNGAIIHYCPDANDCAVVKKDQIYLCDSGAQFLDGTTDVTRTLEKRAFTRVLQGHIAVDSAIFPTGTTGWWLILTDAFARKPLWQDGLGAHGTGHGVGHFLNVHEAYNSTALKPGMTVSNEPGYYADGRFGIRIENIVLVREVKTPNNFGNKGYLGFEHVTMSPMQTKLIDKSLFTAEEVRWLNEYHAEVLGKVSPLLQNDTRALEWLKRECTAI
ncbi:Creatinase/aminopeptidase [Mycena galericulata]|nr:Creatinase/aminopeptidase [Mycena galericulata]